MSPLLIFNLDRIVIEEFFLHKIENHMNAATTNFAFHEYHEKTREISAWIHAKKINTAFT